jgi:hypothetical protein
VREPPRTSPTPPGTPPATSEMAGTGVPAFGPDMATFLGMNVPDVSAAEEATPLEYSERASRAEAASPVEAERAAPSCPPCRGQCFP